MDGRESDGGGTSKPASEEDAPEFDIETEDDAGDRGGAIGNPAVLLPPD